MLKSKTILYNRGDRIDRISNCMETRRTLLINEVQSNDCELALRFEEACKEKL